MKKSRLIRSDFTIQSAIQSFCILYVVIWSISPPLESGTIWRILALGSVVVWFAVEVFNNLFFTKNDVTAVLFMVAVALTSYIENGDISSILKNIALFMLALLFIMQFRYENRWSELSFIIPITLLFLIYFNYKTYQVIIVDPIIARKIVRNDPDMEQYLSQGVGGYALIYLQVIICPAIVMWVFKSFKINKILFAIGVAWVVTYYLVVANAGYSLAIYVSVASTIIAFFYRGKRIGPAVIVIFVLFAGSLAALLYWTGLRNYLLQVFDGTAVAKKINDLVATNETGEAEGSIYSRVKAYQNSLNVILQYPLVGSFWESSGGGHSAILDMFAKYGVLGGIFYLRAFYLELFHLKKKLSENKFAIRTCNEVFASILFVGLLDSIPYELMIMVLIIFPTIVQTIYDWDERLKPNENSVDS